MSVVFADAFKEGLDASKPWGPEAAASGSDLPEVQIVAGELPRMLQEAEQALRAVPAERQMYRRGSQLVRLARLTSTEVDRFRDGVRRQAGALTIMAVSLDYLVIELAKCARWRKWDARAKEFRPANPPIDVARGLLATVDTLQLPRLASVIEAPTLRPDGSILDRPGYDEQTGIFFDPGQEQFQPVPLRPSKTDARKALDRMAHHFRGFPFADPQVEGGPSAAGASRSVALSALLTAGVRRTLPSAPMHVGDASMPGSGKSLWVDAVAMTWTGRPAPVMSHTEGDEERKRLLALLLAGDLVISIDNIDRPLGSDVLCTVLTQPVFQDRVLGASQTITVGTASLFMATGNNIRVLGDMARRTLLCRLDPQCERPDERHFGFDLKVDVLRDRAQIVVDALTVLRAYVVAGQPKPAGMKPYGSFERWSDLVRGALVWLGEQDPLASRQAIEAGDPERTVLRAVFQAWHKSFGTSVQLVKDILRTANTAQYDHQELAAALDLVPARAELTPKVLGNWLAKYEGRIEGGLRLSRVGSYQRAVMWRIAPVESPAGEFDEFREPSPKYAREVS